MATINIRIDEDLKNKATKTLDKMGLDLSGAIKMFLHQTVKEDALPFRPKNNPKEVRAIWDREVSYAIKHGKAFRTAKELFADLEK